MSDARVTREGLKGVRPGRAAPATYSTTRPHRTGRRRGEEPMVPPADFTSYYGKSIINPPVWKMPDIPGYFYLGGMAGGSSLLAAAASATGKPELARAAKVGAASGGVLSLVALVHDLGRPARFLNMLRVFKITSPMSVGSWLLAGYVPLTVVAAGSELTGRWRRLGTAATVGAAALAPGIASYTGALVSDTAVPAWHDGYRELPYLFVGSGAIAAGGLGMALAPPEQRALPRRVALLGVAADLVSSRRMERRLGMVGEPYRKGGSGAMMRMGQLLGVAGAIASLVGSQRVTRISGVALMAASAFTKFGIFAAGMRSARDPKYTVLPQRERLTKQEQTGAS